VVPPVGVLDGGSGKTVRLLGDTSRKIDRGDMPSGYAPRIWETSARSVMLVGNLWGSAAEKRVQQAKVVSRTYPHHLDPVHRVW
jgi:hypothetical protein